jgi:hypothetical protein
LAKPLLIALSTLFASHGVEGGRDHEEAKADHDKGRI